MFPSNILVTGGSGFIGAHLCRRVLDFGHDQIHHLAAPPRRALPAGSGPDNEDVRARLGQYALPAKRCAETLFFDYHRQPGLAIKVARIFDTYGLRMQPDDGRVISNFIVQALRGEPLTV